MRRSMLQATVVAMALAPVAAAAYPIGVRIDGAPVRFQGTRPQQINGHVLVPFREVLEQMGAQVNWDARSQTVTASRGQQTIELPLGARTARVNGETVRLEQPAMMIGGATMVPLRFVGESLGADVKWDARDQIVMIETGQRLSDGSSTSTRAHVTRGGRRVTLPEGTVVPVRLDTSLSSNNSQAGDQFTATVVAGQDTAGLPDGTRIEGVIRDSAASSGSKPGILDMDFRRIVFPNGDSQPLTASLYSLDAKSVQRASDGRLTANSKKGTDTLKWVGIGAGAGLLLSKVVKGNTILDTLLGAGAGYLYDQVQGKKPSDVNLKPGTQFGVRVDRDLAFNASDLGTGSGTNR